MTLIKRNLDLLQGAKLLGRRRLDKYYACRWISPLMAIKELISTSTLSHSSELRWSASELDSESERSWIGKNKIGVGVGVDLLRGSWSCSWSLDRLFENDEGVGKELDWFFFKRSWSWSGFGVAHSRSSPSLAVHDDTVALIVLLWLKELIITFQKRVSEFVDERYLFLFYIKSISAERSDQIVSMLNTVGRWRPLKVRVQRYLRQTSRMLMSI
jgi:hypothetical protein